MATEKLKQYILVKYIITFCNLIFLLSGTKYIYAAIQNILLSLTLSGGKEQGTGNSDILRSARLLNTLLYMYPKNNRAHSLKMKSQCESLYHKA